MTEKNEPQAAPKSTGSPAWVKILLGLSLALNLLVLGVIAGAAFNGKRFGDRAGIGNFAMPFVIALDREDRRNLMRAVREDVGEGNIPNRRERRGLYQDMLSEIEADELDRDALNALLTRQTDGAKSFLDVMQGTWLNRMEEMTATERKAYAARVREVLKRGPRGRDPEKR